MIKKLFKTIFILTLCLGITLPSNTGSANVSDGSAFITKSEMAYQLNNLSSRMTQLENSLDSHIDTLVSSYLTRNGIWNGAKQIELTDAEKTAGGRILVNLNSSNTSFLYSMAKNSIGVYTFKALTTLVDSCNKSGLVFADFEIKNNALYLAQYSVNSDGQVASGRQYWSDNVCKGTGLIIANMYLNSDTTPISTFKLDDMVAGTYTQPVNGGRNYCYIRREIHFTRGQYRMQFFVSKGDKLSFDIKVYSNYSLPFDAPAEASGTMTHYVNGTMQLYLASMVVY